MSIRSRLIPLWDRAQKYNPWVMFASLLALALAPQVNILTQTAFTTFWKTILDGSYTWAALVGLAILLCDMGVGNYLESLNNPWLEKSFFKKKGNVTYEPITWKRRGLVYIPLLAYCMPLLAAAEEILFRQLASELGIVALMIISGPVFGFIHVFSGANIRRAIGGSAVGIVLALIFLAEGLIAVCVVHASYNLIALVGVVYELRIKKGNSAPSGEALAVQPTT